MDRNEHNANSERTRHEAIVDACAFLLTHTSRVPVLWGPTGAGKTWAAKELAERLQARLVIVPLSTMTAEDAVGFQIEPASTNGDTPALRYAVPEWAAVAAERAANGERTLVLLDDIHLAHASVLGAVYEVLRERRLADLELPADRVFLVAACNADWYPPAGLRTRCVFIHTPYETEYLISICPSGPLAQAWENAVRAPRAEGTDEQGEYSSAPPPAVTVVTAAEGALVNELQVVQFYLLPRDARRVILEAALPAVLAQAIDETIAAGRALDGKQIVALTRDELLTLCERLTPQEVALLFTAAWEALAQVPREVAVRFFANQQFVLQQNPEHLSAWYDAPITPRMREQLDALTDAVEELENEFHATGFIRAEEDGSLTGFIVTNAEEDRDNA